MHFYDKYNSIRSICFYSTDKTQFYCTSKNIIFIEYIADNVTIFIYIYIYT